MSDWNLEFHNIGIKYEKKWVRIKNDQVLKDFLKDPSTKGSILISEYAHKQYQKEIGCPLNITIDSLAIEILGHVYMETFANIAAQLKIKSLTTALEDIKSKTNVIDCGELDVDYNRHIWDSLEKNKSLVYMLCGKNA